MELGAAVIGLGVGEQHARAYASHHDVRLHWVLDFDTLRMAHVVAELGQGRAAPDLATILADPDVQVVSIASYDDHHFDQVMAALGAGKHVFCEKPLCRSVDEVTAIRALLASRPDLHLACNLVLRSAPLYRWLRDAMAGDVLGEAYAFDGDYLYGRIEKITGGWRKDVEGYSVMLGGGVHLVDLMIWLTGQQPTAVTAVGNRICTHGTSFRYADYVAATFEFGSGMVGRVTANFGCVHRHQHVMRVFGTHATFLYDDEGPRLHVRRDPALRATPVVLSPLPASKGDLIPDFIRRIRENADPFEHVSHELAVAAACAAAETSLAHGRTVDILPTGKNNKVEFS